MDWRDKTTYRSKPFVNMTDDCVRVTLHMTRNEWRKLSKMHNIRCYFCGAGDDNHHSFDCQTGLHPDK